MRILCQFLLESKQSFVWEVSKGPYDFFVLKIYEDSPNYNLFETYKQVHMKKLLQCIKLQIIRVRFVTNMDRLRS